MGIRCFGGRNRTGTLVRGIGGFTRVGGIDVAYRLRRRRE